MMSKKTNQDEEKQELSEMEKQNLLLKDLMNLKEVPYYRQQLLGLLERIAKALEDSLENSDDDDKKDNEED